MTQEYIPLRWGDIIRIHGVSAIKDQQVQGLIIAKGFTDSDIYYQKFENFSDVNFYRESLFQILPKSNFDMHDQLLAEDLTPQAKQGIKARAQGEITVFENQIKTKTGQQIMYGSPAIFRHVQSKSYLRGMLKAAQSGNGAFKVQVTEDLSSQLLFKIVSPRTYDGEKDKIYFEDALQVYHIKSDCFMNFSRSDEPIYLDKPIELAQIPEQHSFKAFISDRPMIKKPVGTRISIINESKAKCYWKFIQHCSFQEYSKKSLIKSHDIVYLQHTKNKGLVSSTLSNPATNYLKESKSENLSYECFWELIPKEGSQNFIAKNIVTNQVFKFNDFEVEISPDGENGLEDKGLINLICSEQQQNGKLDRGYRFPTPEDRPKIIEYYEEQMLKINFKAVSQLPEDIFMLFKVGEEVMLDVQYALSSHEPLVKFVEIISSGLVDQLSEGFNYTQFFLSLDELALSNIINILKMLMGKIYSTTYDDIVASGNTPDKNFQKILVETGITLLLMEILNLLYEPFKFIEKSNVPSEDKAIRMKISEIFQNTYHLIEKIANDNEQNRMYISRWVDLFLEHSNKINRSFIQECLVGILQNNPVSIEATITKDKINMIIKCFFEEAKALSENEELTTKYLRLFSTFIKCQDRVIKENQHIILDEFFKNPENELNFKFKTEFKLMNEELDINDPMMKVKSSQVYISFNKSEFMSIPSFFSNQASKWNYFLAYVNLLADICMDRNSQAIQYVSNTLTLQTAAIILFDDQIQQINEHVKKSLLLENSERHIEIINMQQPFVRIAHNVFINNEKFGPIKKIKKISLWYRKFEGQGPVVHEINRTKRVFEGQKQQEEQQYLQNILHYIKQFLKKCDQNINNLAILYTVLDLLKQTIILGLWKTVHSFRELIPLLVLKITKIEEICFFEADEDMKKKNTPQEIVKINKERLKLNRPQISQVIECKIKATQIFKYINELQMDIRLRYIMSFFKGMYEATEDFNVYDYGLEDQMNEDCQDADIERNQTAKNEYIKMDGKAILGGDFKLSDTQEILLKEQLWYNKLKEMTPFSYEATDDPKKDRYLFQGTAEEDQNHEKLFNDMVLSLFELPVYQNKKLLNYSLVMLRGIFEQRRDLLKNMKSMIICGKGNLEEVYVTLKSMRGKFSMLSNRGIVHYQSNYDKSFAYAIWKPYDYLIKDKQKRSGIIQDLFFLSQTLKEGTKLKNIEALMHVDEEIFDLNDVFVPINERQKNNELFQTVNMAEGIYIPLIQYIRIIGCPDFLPEIHRRLLCSIYQYLTLLCFNNLEAKQCLMHYIPDILPHLKKKVCADSFLFEVTRNNKLLVSNEEMVTKIIDAVLDSCLALDLDVFAEAIMIAELEKNDEMHLQSNDYERSRRFFCLRGILLFNEEGYKRNQQILMNSIQYSKYSNLIFKGHFEAKDEKLNNFNLTPTESYIAEHFQLFSALVESGNLINIGKLSNIHPYTDCLKWLEGTVNRWQIRRIFRAYINRLYYVNKDKDIFLFQEFIRRQFDNLNHELKSLTDLHKSRLLTNDLKIKNGIRFTYAQSEIMLMIIQIFITLQEMLLKPEFLRLLRKELAKDSQEKLHYKLIILYENLGCLNKLYPNTKFIISYLKQIKRLMITVLQRFNVRYLQKCAEPRKQFKAIEEQNSQEKEEAKTQKKNYVYDQSKSFFRNLYDMIVGLKAKQNLDNELDDFLNTKNMVNVPEIVMKKKYLEKIYKVSHQKLRPMYLLKKKEVQDHYNPHLQTASSRTYKLLAKPDFNEDEENLELNKKLDIVKKTLDESPIIDKFKDDEFIKLVQTVSKMNETSHDYYEASWRQLREKPEPIVPLKEIITNTFQLMMKEPSKFEDSEKIFVIKLVRCYLTQAVQHKQDYKLSVDKWDADYCSANSAFEERQRQIEECRGSDFIISIFKENLANREQLLNQALLLGIAYLFGGNTVCQDSMLTTLKKDPENTMLISMKNLIKTISEFLINVRKYKDYEKKRQFNYNIVDTYDYFSPSQNIIQKYFGSPKVDKFETQTELNNEKALCRIYRFLQLFCENNNIPMKQFLSRQINEDQEKKTNSINFIEEACLVLRKFFKVMNNKMVTIPANILAFLGQITQLPCLQNQISFLKSTFFEDISFLAQFFNTQENKSQRKFNLEAEGEDDPLMSLMDIYEQGVGLALSNFEGNDPLIVSQFLNKCKPTFLWLVIRSNIWYLLKENYSEEPFFCCAEKENAKLNQKNEIKKEGEQKQNVEEIEGEEKKEEVIEEIKQNQVVEKIDYVTKTFDNLTAQNIHKIIEYEKKKGQQFEGRILNIINVLIILKKVQDFIDDKQKTAYLDRENPNMDDINNIKKAQKFRQKMEQAGEKEYSRFKQFIKIFESLIIQIQVSCNNGKCDGFQYLYFAKHPVFSDSPNDKINYPKFQFLSDETRDNVMMSVGRDTQRDKLITVLQFRQAIYDEIQSNYTLNYNTIDLYGKEVNVPITSSYCESIKKKAGMLSYIIILLMGFLIFVDHDTKEKESLFSYRNLSHKILIRVLCFIQLSITILYCYLWGRMRYSLALKKYLEEGQQQEQQGEQEVQETPPSLNSIYKIGDYLRFILTKITRKIISIIKKLFRLISSTKPYQFIKTPVQILLALHHSQAGFLSLAVFVIASFLGNFYGVQWYTIHIFDFFVNIPMLANVFKAILINIQQLTILSVLATAFIFVFNILSLTTYTPVVYEEQVPQQACETILGCVLDLYTSGAINGDMEQFKFGRFTFDMIYLVFMELLFMNLVGGIMVDAFSQLRSQDQSRDTDKKGQCYICSMTKANMQKTGTTFKRHTNKHLVWNYLYYIYCLYKKDETDYTGIEYTIKNKIENEDVTWFPSMGEEDQGGQIQETMKQLQETIKGLTDKSEEIVEKSISIFEEVNIFKKVGE